MVSLSLAWRGETRIPRWWVSGYTSVSTQPDCAQEISVSSKTDFDGLLGQSGLVHFLERADRTTNCDHAVALGSPHRSVCRGL